MRYINRRAVGVAHSDSLSMNSLLYVRVDADHAGVEVRMIAHQHLWIPGASDKDCVNAAAERSRKDVADLQANEEGKSDNNRRVCAILVVGGRSEDEVEIGKEGTCVSDECSTHTENGADQALINKRVNSTILDHPESGLESTNRSGATVLTSKYLWRRECKPFHIVQCGRRHSD